MTAWRRGRLVAAIAATAVALGATSAHASGVTAFDAEVSQPSGADAVQAGGHPDLTLTFDLPTRTDEHGRIWPQENVRDLHLELPPGLIGDAAALPACPAVLLAKPEAARCPPETQVGVIELGIAFDPGGPLRVGLYNVVPGRGAPAQLGFSALGVAVRLDAGLRDAGEGGLTVSFRELSQALPLTGARIALWGVPADPAHDAARIDPANSLPGIPSTADRRPFLTYPTSCAEVAPVRLRLRGWERPDVWHEASAPLHAAGVPPQAPVGCDRLTLDGRLEARPDSGRRGAPSGLALTIRMSQHSDPDGLAFSTLRKAAVALPRGMSLSPSGAAGLVTCDAKVCPAAARLGDVELTTPLLAEPLSGAAYLARPADPFDGTLGILLDVAGTGVALRIEGEVALDPATGRLTATFDELPQLPLETLSLRFYDGPAALLALPATCGPATTVATLTPHSGNPPVTVETAFDVSQDGAGAPCPARGFTPGFAAGSANAVAGASAPFTLRFARTDEDQELIGFSADLPPGLLGRIASVPALCPDGAASAGACDEASRVGTATITAGPGATPAVLTGGVHLTGPYRGAPFGLAIVVPAVAGPLRLGTVVVRAAIDVDRFDASLRVAADPLPTALAGIPLQVRTVDLRLDRPGFTTNPTSCAPTRVDGQVRSAEAAVAAVSARYAVGDCAALPFTPRMTLRAGARGSTRKGVPAPLRVALRMPAQQASARAVRVTLPDTLNARLPVLNRACTPADLAADRCASRIGDATVITPLLRDPLRGAIFLVWDRTERMPELVVRLRGQLALDLGGRLRIAGRRIATVFDPLPDVPISRLELKFVGGRDGALGTNVDLCGRAAARRGWADASLRSHSGRHLRQSPRMLTVGCRLR